MCHILVVHCVHGRLKTSIRDCSYLLCGPNQEKSHSRALWQINASFVPWFCWERPTSRRHSCKLPWRNYQQSKAEPNFGVLANNTTTYYSKTDWNQNFGATTCRLGTKLPKVSSHDHGLKRLSYFALAPYLRNGWEKICRKDWLQWSGTLLGYPQTLAPNFRLFYF